MLQKITLALLLGGVCLIGCSGEPSEGDKKATTEKFEKMNKNAAEGEVSR